MRRLLLPCLLLVIAAAPAAALAQSGADPAAPEPAAPDAVTLPTDEVGRSTATVKGTVDPNGAPTRYRFEYGTSTAYGYATGDQPVGSGDDPIDVEEPLAGLADDTTFHYRVIAWPADDPSAIVRGADQTFRTIKPPRAHSDGVLETHLDGATVRGTVNPSGSPTSYWFEYGRTRAYGATTPVGNAGEGTSGVQVSAVLGGLEAHKSYHYRVVAENAAGLKHGHDRRFRTLRQPTAITVLNPVRRLRFGAITHVDGQVTGTAVGGVRVALQAQAYPFKDDFVQQGPSVPTRADGSFSLLSPPLWISTRLRVVTKTVLEATSAPVVAFSRVIVAARARRRGARHVRISGNVTPRIRHARVSLQRRRHHRWVFVRHTRTRKIGRYRFGYRVTVPRARHRRRYRVLVTPRRLSHARGKSRAITVRGTRRHHR